MNAVKKLFSLEKENEWYQFPLRQTSHANNIKYKIKVEEQIEVRDESETSNSRRILLLILIIIVMAAIAIAIVTYLRIFKTDDDDKQHTLNGNQETPSSGIDFSTTTTIPTSGVRGKQFVVLFTKNLRNAEKSIYVTSEKDIAINITTSEYLDTTLKFAIDRSVVASSPYKITLPHAIQLNHNQVEKKGIFLETSNDVSVFLEDFERLSADSTAVIPVHKLGTYHIIVTMPPDSFKSHIAVASLEDDTEISMRFKMAVDLPLTIFGNSFRSGDVFNLRLNKFETFLVGHSKDLTGTLVNSSAPIAVFSGDECTLLLSRGACDHLVEQVPPFSNLDNVFIVPSHAEDRTTVVRVTAGENTNLTYTMNSTTTALTLHTGNSHEISISTSQVCLIQSEGPILVTSVSVASTSTSNGDPYMTIVPGIHQFIDYYKVPIPYRYNTNYISITINSSAVSYILTNGTSILQSNIVYESPINSATWNFTVLTLSVIPGELTIHTSDHSPFGLLIYGHGSYVGYGFSGNTLLQDDV